MIKGLKEFQAVKFNDVYMVALPRGIFELNGVEITSKTGFNQPVSQFMVADITCIRKKIIPHRVTKHYVKNDDPESIMSTKDHEEAIFKYRDKYADEDGDTLWPNLDVEMECRKQLQEIYKFQPVYETPEPYYEAVEISLIGSQEDTGSEFIETPFLVGQTDWMGNGVYRVRLSHIAMDEFKKLVAEYDVKYDLPNHSHLEYVKVKGEYLLTKETARWVKDSSAESFSMTLEEAKEAEGRVRGKLRSIFNLHINENELNPITAAEVYRELGTISRNVQDLDVYRKSENNQLFLAKKIRELQEKVLKESS